MLQRGLVGLAESLHPLDVMPKVVILLALLILISVLPLHIPRNGKTGIEEAIMGVPGGMLALIINPERFLRYLRARGLPVYIGLPGWEIYLAMPGDQARALFRSSSNLVPIPSLLGALITFFGLPRIDRRIFEHDHISKFEAGTGLLTRHGDPSRRIMEHQRKDFITFLHGTNLKRIMARHMANLVREISLVENVDKEWVIFPDLYRLVTAWIFRAQVQALYGTLLLQRFPSLFDDFCAFYEAFPVVSRRLPQWSFPSAYRAQKRMQENFRDWNNLRKGLSQGESDISDVDYDPVCGSAYIQRMARRHEELGFSEEGIASVMFGYLFVTMANTLPAALWMILHILLDTDLTSRIESELSLAFQPASAVPDISALADAPLLNSVYHETLRLHVAGSVGRVSLNPEFQLAGRWSIRPGIPIMSANWFGGLSESYWNARGGRPDGTPSHPANTFWAERFLEQRNESETKPIFEEASSGLVGENAARIRRKAKLMRSGLDGHWFPFGGGASRCPGEELARQTILSSVALVIGMLRIDILEPGQAAKARSRLRTLPFGSHAFDRQVSVRVRKKW